MKPFLLIALVSLLAATAAAYAGVPDYAELVDMELLIPSDEGVVQVEVAGVDSKDLVGRYVGDSLFLPYGALCDFLHFRNRVTEDLATISGVGVKNRSYEISRRYGHARIGDDTIQIAPSDIRIARGEVYIEESLLCRLLGVNGHFDALQLKVRIDADPTIPLVRWHHGEELFGVQQAIGTSSMNASGSVFERHLFRGSIVNWTVANSTFGTQRTSTSATLLAGADLLYGCLELGGSMAIPSGMNNTVRGALNLWRWTYATPTSTLFSQVTLGTTSVAEFGVYGMELTNRRLSPRTDFTSYTLEGQSQPGWIVEMYDGDHLSEVVHADSTGRYRFVVPMGYGTIDRRIRQMGPSGEVIIEHRRLQLASEMIPSGEIEYTAGFGFEKLAVASPVVGSARVGIGITDHLTLVSNALYKSEGIGRWNPDSIAPTFNANLWLGGTTTASVGYNVRGRLLNSEVGFVTADNSVLRLGLDSMTSNASSFTANGTTTVPIGPITIGGDCRYHQGIEERRIEATPRLSGYVAGISFEGSYTMARRLAGRGENLPTLGGDVASLRLLLSPVDGLLLAMNGGYDINRRKPTTIEVTTYTRLTERVGLSLGYSILGTNWSNGRVQAEFTFDLPSFRGATTAMRGEEGISTLSYAQGGMVISSGGVIPRNDINVGTAAILVHGFYDRNNNGRRDDGEELLEDPASELVMGSSTVESNENGIYRGIPAWRECTVIIDQWCMSGRSLFPGRTRFNLTTSPSGVHQIEVPFSEGVDLGGICEVGGQTTSPRAQETHRPVLTGLRLQLINLETSALYNGEVFSDGTIYIPAVGVGTYRVVFDPTQLESRRLCATTDPKPITVTTTTRTIPTLVLNRCTEDGTDK
jgi:hypothetical protein